MIRVRIELPHHHPFGSLRLRGMCEDLRTVIAATTGFNPSAIILSVGVYHYALVDGLIIDVTIGNQANVPVRSVAKGLQEYFTTDPYPTGYTAGFIPVTGIILDATTGISYPVQISQP